MASNKESSQQGSGSQKGSGSGQDNQGNQQQGGGKGVLLTGLVILVLVLLAVYGYYWAMSDSGQRAMSGIKEFISKNNPIKWYMDLISQAEDVGKNEWSSVPNATSSVKGLVFKDFRAVSTAEYPQGSPISLEYVLELQSFEAENLPVTVDCSLRDKGLSSTQSNDGTTGITIKPNREFTVSGNRIYDDVRCLVSPTITQALDGTVAFVGAVKFPFKTKDVSLPVYFTTKNVEMQLNGQDFFSRFKIEESKPIRAVYNGEPIEVGIGVSTENRQPVVIGEGRTPLVGISLKNRWSGYMSQLSELVLEVPREMTISKDLSQNPNQLCPFILSRTGARVNEYRIADEVKGTISISAGRVKTFECWFDVTDDMIDSNSFYTKRAYKVNAEYMYHLENRTTSVTIKKIGGSDGKAITSEVIPI